MSTSPIILLCDHILKLDNDTSLATYYKQLADLLYDNVKKSRASYCGYIDDIDSVSNCCLSFDWDQTHGASEGKPKNRIDLIDGVCSAEEIDLGQILQGLPLDEAIESIKIYAKYLTAVHEMPTLWHPNIEKLQGDYSQYNTMFSDFINTFQGINFMCPFPTYEDTWHKRYSTWQENIVTVVSGCSPKDLDGFVKLTKRIAAIEGNVDGIKADQLKAIKILRIIVMAYRQKQEKWAITRKAILSILYPPTVNYTIYNPDYVNDILSLSDQRLAKAILTALLEEAQCQDAANKADKILSDVSGKEYTRLAQQLTKNRHDESESKTLYLEQPAPRLRESRD